MPNRRLAAIMFADIAGYTAMMQRDEQLGLARVRRFVNVAKTRVEAHAGEMVDLRGDGGLCVFPSAVDALQCAMDIQRDLQTEPRVPLRIGIHLGDIVAQDGTVYGDGVNLASRVESIAVPGSVLLTGQVAAHLKSHPEFRLHTLGSFHFKNVEAPMEVFALANEGLVVPRRSQLKGKLERPVGRRRWLLPAAGSVLVLLLVLLWWMNRGGSQQEESIPEALRQERIAVMAFENQTSDAELEAFGRMISDWLTKGLMESEEAQVVSAANIQAQVQLAGIRNLDRPESAVELGKTTGIGVVIGGNYYLLRDSLFIHARILNATDGTYLKVLDLSGPRDQLLPLLDELTQQVLGYWAVKEQERFQQNPPTLEAYRAYTRSKAYYISDPSRAEDLLRQAFRLDSTFFEPLFELNGLYAKEGQDSLREVTLTLLEERQSDFTRWEQLRYLELKARERRDWLEAGELAEQLFRLDPSDLRANARAVSHYNRINYPGRARVLIDDVDPRFLPAKEAYEISWSEVNEAFTCFRLSRYPDVVALASAYDFPKTPDALAVMHLKSLVRMGKTDSLGAVFRSYVEKGTYSTAGAPSPLGTLYTLLCDALWLYGDAGLLKRFAKDFKAWVLQHPDAPGYEHDLGYAYFFLEEYPLALAQWEAEEVYDESVPGWMRYPLEIEHLSRLGFTYATLGDTSRAKAQIERIRSHPDSFAGLKGVQLYYQARILAALGQDAEAVASLEKAVREGYSFFRPAVFDTDPFLKPLQGYQPFERLIAPKG